MVATDAPFKVQLVAPLVDQEIVVPVPVSTVVCPAEKEGTEGSGVQVGKSVAPLLHMVDPVGVPPGLLGPASLVLQPPLLQTTQLPPYHTVLTGQ